MIKPEELEKLKANVVKFFGNGLIHEKVIAMHLVIGMADTRHSVSTEADTVMRRVQSGIDWNEKVKVDRKKKSTMFFITLTGLGGIIYLFFSLSFFIKKTSNIISKYNDNFFEDFLRPDFLTFSQYSFLRSSNFEIKRC